MKRTLAFLYVFTALSFISLLLTNCGGCNNGDRLESLGEANFGFELLDAKTGRDLFSTSAYSIDSIKLINTATPITKLRSGIERNILRIDTIYNETQN